MSRVIFVLGFFLVAGNRSQANETIASKAMPGWVGALAFYWDNSILAVGTSDGMVKFLHTEGFKETKEYKRHSDAVAGLIFPRFTRSIVSVGHDRALYWQGNNMRIIKLTGHKGAILSVAGTAKEGWQLFTGSMDGSIRVWKDGEAISALNDHTSWVNSLAIDKEETLLASGSSDNTIHVRTLKNLKLVQTFRVSEGEVRSVALSPDGKLLAAGIRYGWVRVWDLESKKVVFNIKAHEGETMAVAFTPDGKTLASGGGDWNQPGEVRLYDVAGWKERTTLKHSGEVLCLAISPDGRLLAAGAWNRTVRIWELEPKRK